MSNASDQHCDSRCLLQGEPFKFFDGGGLYLLIIPTTGKLWRLKYRYGGKEKKLALGMFPDRVGRAELCRLPLGAECDAQGLFFAQAGVLQTLDGALPAL